MVQALPFLDHAPTTGSGKRTGWEQEIDMMQIWFRQDTGADVWRSEQLNFWSNLWYSRNLKRGVTLPLWMQGGNETGQNLAHRLWEAAEN